MGASDRHSWKGGCFKLVERHKTSSGERKRNKQLWEAGSLGWENGKAGETPGLGVSLGHARELLGERGAMKGFLAGACHGHRESTVRTEITAVPRPLAQTQQQVWLRPRARCMVGSFGKPENQEERGGGERNKWVLGKNSTRKEKGREQKGRK